MSNAQNISWENFQVSREGRAARYGHRSVVVWLTGLSGSGKSAITDRLEAQLFEQGIKTCRLDGDNIRHGISNDLGFSIKDRSENVRRVAEIAKLFVDSGAVALVSLISPLMGERAEAKSIIGTDDFIEIFVDCPLAVCEERDKKGLYAKARAGEIKDFTGITSPYEAPKNPDLRLDTNSQSLEQCSEHLLQLVTGRIL